MTISHKALKIPHTEAGMTIGLLGGSFNPPHAGHRHISLTILNKFKLDQIWWVVSPGNPLKSHKDLQNLEERIDLCKKCSNHPRIKITGFEANRPNAYTANTLAYLHERRKSVNFIWIMGADNLGQFHLWQNWQKIFLTMPILVHDRPGYRYKALSSKAASHFKQKYIPEKDAANLALRYPPAWTFLTAPLSHLSSTEIREKN